MLTFRSTWPSAWRWRHEAARRVLDPRRARALRNNIAAAIHRVNDMHGTAVTHSRVGEWRRGVYVPSQAFLSTMLFRTLPWALREAGIDVDAAQMQRLQVLLWTPVEKNGRHVLELL